MKHKQVLDLGANEYKELQVLSMYRELECWLIR